MAEHPAARLRRVAREMGTPLSVDRCTMCGDLGWILDCNDLGKPGSRMVELLPCLLPDCEASGQPIQNLNFGRGAGFNHVSWQPGKRKIMSVSVQ